MGFAVSTNELEETGGVLTNGSAAACVSPAQRVTGETQGGNGREERDVGQEVQQHFKQAGSLKSF